MIAPLTSHPAGPPLHVFVVAGEPSGDRLGGALIGGLRERLGSRLRVSGVGGPRMAAAGVESLFPIDDFGTVGFMTILRRLPVVMRHVRETATAAVAARPDALVIIDSPDFTHRVARRVRRAAPSIPIVNYVSPSVWAWRPWRARAMRRYVEHVLALLPFEPDVHARLGGPACTYVGHPLIEEIAELRPSAEEARRRLDGRPVLLVVPGSRSGEIRRLLAIFGEAAERVHASGVSFDIVIPTLPHLAERVRAATATWPVPARIVVEPDDKHAAFRVARAALVKSGTVTLELALAGVPMVAAYKVSLMEELVARAAINVPSVILANLVLGENIVPEFLQRDCTPQNLAQALAPLLGETPERRRQTEAFSRLDRIMQIGEAAPSRRAADIVLGLLAPQINLGAPPSPRGSLAGSRR
jgi:lipid-A-disaccharide synthase